MYRPLVVKPLRKRPIPVPTLRWRGTIVRDLTETAWDGVEWNNLAHDMDQRRAVMTLP